ncbi:UNVERIFIED_CONTAM: hypothetical protein PPE77_02855 [Enterobacter cloacae]
MNIFTTSGALPHENQKEYAQAKYNSGIVIAREIYRPFTPSFKGEARQNGANIAPLALSVAVIGQSP